MTGAAGQVTLAENLRGAAYMLIAMAAFIPGDACMKMVTEQMPLYQAVTIRGLITLPMLIALAQLSGGLQLRRLWLSRRVVGLRLIGEVGATLSFFVALPNMALGTLTAIMQSAPIAVTAAAVVFMRERVGWRRASAIAVGFVGVLVIVRPGPEGLNLYAVAGLVSVAFVALRDLSTRLLPEDAPSIGVAFATAVAVLVTFALLSLAVPWQAVTLEQLGLIALAAVFVNTGYLFIIMVMRVGDVGFITPFRYSALLWGLVLGWLFWGDFPDPLTLLGAGIVVASGVFILLREARLQRNDNS